MMAFGRNVPTRASAGGYRKCSAAGLADVDVEVRAPVYRFGHSRRTARVDLVRSMRPYVLELGLASEAELTRLAAARRGTGRPWADAPGTGR